MAFAQKLYFNQSLETTDKYFTEEGYLVNKNVPIARSGIFKYKGFEFGLEGKDANRDIIVYRPLAIFNEALLNKFNALDVTNSHPVNGINAENFRNEVIGVCTKVYLQDNDIIAEEVIIKDKSSINEAENEGKKELSIGFDATYDPTEGEINGQKYEYIETITNINHLGLVKKGKAGAKYRLNEDLTTIKNGDIMLMVKRKIGNVEVEMPQEAANAYDEMVKKETVEHESEKKNEVGAEAMHAMLQEIISLLKGKHQQNEKEVDVKSENEVTDTKVKEEEKHEKELSKEKEVPGDKVNNMGNSADLAKKMANGANAEFADSIKDKSISGENMKNAFTREETPEDVISNFLNSFKK